MPELVPQEIEKLLKQIREDIRQLCLGEKGYVMNVRDISSAYTTLEDDDVLMCWGDTTITLLTVTDVTGKMYWIKDISTNQVTIDSEDNIDDVTRVNIDASESACLVNDGAEWRIISGYSL